MDVLQDQEDAPNVTHLNIFEFSKCLVNYIFETFDTFEFFEMFKWLTFVNVKQYVQHQNFSASAQSCNCKACIVDTLCK